MTKEELKRKAGSRVEENRNNLQLLWDNIVKGQKKQIIKIPEIKAMFDLYGVKYEE